MPCYAPLGAWYREPRVAFGYFRGARKISLPCQKCIGCKLDHSKDWATRCAHQAKLHKHNCFLTLTLNDDNLTGKYWTGLRNDLGQKVYGGNLNHRDVQTFLKRLRSYTEYHACSPQNNVVLAPPGLTAKPPIEGARKPAEMLYYMCGEYGEKYRRPHYHICLFGADFKDKKLFTRTPAGSDSYTSETLTTLWGNGNAFIGELNWQSAAYAARYCLKKMTGEPAKSHYTVVDAETGEIQQLLPEYARMSRSIGIGKAWLQQYQNDVYPHGYVVLHNGSKTTTPKYYDKIYRKENENEYKKMKATRAKAADKNFDEGSKQRLQARRITAERAIRALQQKF